MYMHAFLQGCYKVFMNDSDSVHDLLQDCYMEERLKYLKEVEKNKKYNMDKKFKATQVPIASDYNEEDQQTNSPLKVKALSGSLFSKHQYFRDK